MAIYRESQQLVVKFDGESHEDHQISARMLGASLVGMADLLQAIRGVEAFKQVDGPAVEVQALEPGSFDVVFLITAVGDAWSGVRQTLVGDDAQAATTLAGFVGLGISVFKYLKRQGGKKVTSKVVDPETGSIQVGFDDGSSEEMEPSAYQAFASPAVRKAAHQTVAPLAAGTTIINITGDNNEVTINASEAKNIVPEFEEAEDLKSRTDEVWAEPLAASFDGEGQWRLSVDDRTVSATITDEVFLNQVAAGRSIAKTDRFRILLRTDPYRTKTRQLRYHYYVDQVLEQRRGDDVDRPTLFDDAGAPDQE